MVENKTCMIKYEIQTREYVGVSIHGKKMGVLEKTRAKRSKRAQGYFGNFWIFGLQG